MAGKRIHHARNAIHRRPSGVNETLNSLFEEKKPSICHLEKEIRNANPMPVFKATQRSSKESESYKWDAVPSL